LRAAQGNKVVFHTGLCVLQQSSGFCELDEELFEVEFRHLEDDQLERYLAIEQPYQCAGSFKSEGLGIVLFDRMCGDDPTALIGLPLIRLTKMLESAGLAVI
ncbi:MAG: septum formation inhibitor Maf, partial [Gammaproteobacteria bacterium]|nr:septum formation inhibitor Maf [Gammaproteobacteria bacterium]